MQVLLARPQFLSEAEQVTELSDMALFSAGKRAQQQGQQQCPKQKLQQQGYQQYRYQRPPPPPLPNGPIPMELGVVQSQQLCGQHPPQFSVVRQIVYYQCGKQGHIKKNCKVKIGDPQQQLPNQNWGQYPQFGCIQQPLQFYPHYSHYGRPAVYNNLQVSPALEQPNGIAHQPPPQQQPAAQMPPPPPLNQIGGSY